MDLNVSNAIANLEKVFGKGNNNGWGSNVIVENASLNTSTDMIALKHYKAFVGIKWNQDSEPYWMSVWKRVYTLTPTQSANFPDTLNKLQKDIPSIELLTNLIENVNDAQNALKAFFECEELDETGLYTIGDGEALSGIFISGHLTSGEQCSVMAMMD